MKIHKGSIEQLASEGHITLQVPQYSIDTRPNPPPIPTEDIPDDWIETLRSSNSRRCCGKEDGFWFLTEKGWAAKKDDIKAAFLKAKHKRGTWDDFEAHAIKHFKAVAASNARYLKLLQDRIDRFKAVM